jgi:4'-phosphopantetheinyl transferase
MNSFTLSINSFSFVDVGWESVAGQPSLFTDEVHLWWLPLVADEDAEIRYKAYLSERETEKFERLPDRERKKRFLAGRGILRELIAAYLNLPPSKVNIRFGELGKPYVRAGEDGTAALSFNYSDSRGMGLFAFSWGREVGVDLEWLGRRGRFRQIVERRFAPTEHHALLDGLDEVGRAERFLACWTRKEGYGKARGVGIHYPMREIDLCSDCELPSRRIESGHGEWYLSQVLLPPDYVGCLVTEGGKERPIRAFRR